MKTSRGDIKQAAYNRMGNLGLESLHARTVAADLNINHATVHYYFRRRIDLLEGVAQFAFEQLKTDRAKFREGFSRPGDLLESELALAEAYAKPSSRFVKVFAGLYVASVENPKLKKILQQIWTEWLAAIADVMPGAKTRKGSPYSDPEMLLSHLFGIAVAAHMLEGKFKPGSKIDAVYGSLFGT